MRNSLNSPPRSEIQAVVDSGDQTLLSPASHRKYQTGNSKMRWLTRDTCWPVMTEHIVRTWLRFLEVEQYWDSFIENGYDDMETVKLIEIQDLEAIGVTRSDHKKYLLENVRTLREQGAAWVYLVTGQHQLQTNTASDHDTDTRWARTRLVVEAVNSFIGLLESILNVRIMKKEKHIKENVSLLRPLTLG